MGQAQINVRTRACSRTSIARTKQAALTHNVRGKELNKPGRCENKEFYNFIKIPEIHQIDNFLFQKYSVGKKWQPC